GPPRYPRIRSIQDCIDAGDAALSAAQNGGKGAIVSDQTGATPRSPGLGSARRKAVDLTQLVETSVIDGNLLPLVIQPAVEGVDLAEWTVANREQIDAYFDKHGAVLFRG